MTVKGNLIENWDRQYQPIEVTYNEKVDNPINFTQRFLYQFVHEDIMMYLPDYKKAKILECGCGGARNSVYLALKGFDVSCSDFSQEGLRLAKANFNALNLRGTFLLDDLMNSKIEPESFDCVMSFGLLEHFKDLDPVVKAITRLVKPGGIQIHIIIPKKFSVQTLANIIWFPYRFLYYALKKREFHNIIKKSYRDFPHYENQFSAEENAQAFLKGGNEILCCEPWDIIFPVIHLPFRIGNAIVRLFPGGVEKMYRKLRHGSTSRLLFFLSPAIWLACRKKAS
jgi:SAM-dependent methyltransferase